MDRVKASGENRSIQIKYRDFFNDLPHPARGDPRIGKTEKKFSIAVTHFNIFYYNIEIHMILVC